MYLWDEKNIIMTKGDTMSFGIEIDFDHEPSEIDYARFVVAKDYETAPVIEKVLGDGISEVETGQYAVRIPPEDTQDIKAGKYLYSLTLGQNEDRFTVLRGILEIRDLIEVY